MGQAKLRGTREQRVAEAIAERQEYLRKREEARQKALEQRQAIAAKKWADMTPEQREAAIEKAKQEAANFGQLQEIFGFDVANALASVMFK